MLQQRNLLVKNRQNKRLDSADGSDGEDEIAAVGADEKSDDDNSEIRSLTSAKQARGEKAQVAHVAPVGAMMVPANASIETKDLLARIDQLETEKAEAEEEKLELAKAVKNLNELLKECKKVQLIQQKQIENAEIQGATILPAEAIEEHNKIALRKSKSLKKKKSRKRAADAEEEEEDDEGEIFKDNPELKKMVDNLVPEENQENTVEEAKKLMMIYNSSNKDLQGEIKRLSKENDVLKKSLQELKHRENDEDGDTLENLADENKALVAQIKSLKKQVTEAKASAPGASHAKETNRSKHADDSADVNAEKRDSEKHITPIMVGEGNDGP